MHENFDSRCKQTEHPAWKIWPRIEFAILHLCVLGICAVLLGAFWAQFVNREYPCPLCLLQRMAMILAAVGSIFVITHGHYARIQGFSVMGLGYGMSILSALMGLMISTRQIILHLKPGDAGYGTPVFGLHLYTWAAIVFLVVILVSGVMLIFGREPVIHCPICHESGRTTRAAVANSRLKWYSWITFWLFGAIISINAIAAFTESGFHAFLPDNPTSYRLFEDWSDAESTGGDAGSP